MHKLPMKFKEILLPTMLILEEDKVAQVMEEEDSFQMAEVVQVIEVMVAEAEEVIRQCVRFVVVLVMLP